ncbi:MAG: hypothetical protein Q4C56_05630, partial [Peptococcaceae bacterium]|nr:hypothetical protein [Peptococcaceae bacterium]
MDLSQHAAYLRGLAEGKKLTEDELKGDFVKALLDCINDMAEEIETLEDYLHELTEYAEAIDEDLGDVEDFVFDEYDDDVDFCDCGCDHDHDHDHEGIFVETECPACGETIGYYEGIYDDDEPVEVLCPNCDTVVAVIGGD